MKFCLTVLLLLSLTGCTAYTQKPEPTHEPVVTKPIIKSESDYIVTTHYHDKSALDEIQIGRYTVAESSATNEQIHLLNVLIKTSIPKMYTTVGEAIRFLLRRSGYSLALPASMDKDVRYLLMLPLPATHRKIGPMTLEKALLMLVGEAYAMDIDPVHRKVSFKKDEVQSS